MGHVGDCSEPYYVASTLSKAKTWIKKKAKEESKKDPHMKSYYKVNPYGHWSVQKWKMDSEVNKSATNIRVKIPLSPQLISS